MHVGAHCSKRDHPKIAVEIKPLCSDRSVTVRAIADTGAQTNLWGFTEFCKAGYSIQLLDSVSVQLSAANKQHIDVVGGFKAEFSGESPTGKKVSCQDMVYVR